MADKPNPLNPLLGKIERFEYSAKGARQWESARVEWTLRRLTLLKQQKEILSSAVDGLYSFEEFNRVVDFPVTLYGEQLTAEPPIHRDTRSIHPLWFKSFTKLPFVKYYEEKFLSAVDKTKPVGMVFPRKGFSQGLIVHNGDWDLFVPPNSSCHVFKGGNKSDVKLVVQPYTTFIDGIKESLM